MQPQLSQEDQLDLYLGRSLRQLAENSDFGAAVFEFAECPTCSEVQIALHSFTEIIVCGTCGQRFPSRTPNWDDEGEPRTIDWIEAVQALENADPKAARFVFDLALALAERRTV